MVRPASILAALLVLASGLGGCGEGEAPPGDPTPSPEESSPPTPPADVSVEIEAEAPGGPPRVVFLGDSLTAGLSLDEDQAFPARVAESLREQGLALVVVNAGVSGDTSAGGLARLDWLLRQDPDVMVVGLGANDGLRGLPLSMTEENLRQVVERSQAAGARVLLLGMLLPRNYGADYADGFAAIYPRLAEQLGVPLVPFLLEGVALQPELNLSDGIHPNPAGHRRVAETVEPFLREVLQGLEAGAGPG